MISGDKLEMEVCLELIEHLLEEFNCQIAYDVELKEVILFDKDTLKFQVIK